MYKHLLYIMFKLQKKNDIEMRWNADNEIKQ